MLYLIDNEQGKGITRDRIGGKGSSNDIKGFVCFCSNEKIMVIPGEVTRHDDSKIFMGIRKGNR